MGSGRADVAVAVIVVVPDPLTVAIDVVLLVVALAEALLLFAGPLAGPPLWAMAGEANTPISTAMAEAMAGL